MQVMLPKHKIHESLTWNDSRDHLQSNTVLFCRLQFHVQ